MAIVTLRAYLDEVQDLISKEALEEAIGHCKYILQTFPKNVAVYRLLGQGLLGKARFQEASDIFQRVLSAVPDDTTAHIAMSELYSEQDAVSQATWHLERAFEQDPNNQALKDELRRMYEQRDGAAPDHVQLTRGALARLYYRGRLYEQATAELQAVLEDESDRPDLLLLLAQTLWDNNHLVEAGETALRVLEMLPDALEGNALLARLWLGQKRPSDAVPFIDRVQALDPFRALELLAPENPAAGDEITLPHLDWSARTNVAMLTDTPEWIQDVGNMFENSSVPERESDPFGLERRAAATDWMTNFAAPGDSAPPTPDWFAPVPPPVQADPEPSSTSIPAALDSMPDWFAEVAQTSEPAASALPSWLEEDEPAPPAEPPRVHSGYTDLLGQIASVRQQDEPVPSWADETPAAPDESPIPSWADDSAAVKAADDTSDVPDWFTNWDAPANATPNDNLSPAADTQAPEPDVAEGTPDWFSDLGMSDAAAEPETVSSDMPDWMSTLAPAETTSEPAMSTPEPTVSDSTPDWLSDLGAVSSTPAEPVPAESEAAPGDDMPDWMSALAPAEPTSEPAMSVPEPTISDSAPDWLSDLGAASSIPTEPVPAESEAAPGDDMPDWMSALAPAEPASEPAMTDPEPTISDSAPEWLSDLGAASSIPTEPAPAESEAAPGDMPDWISALAPEPSSEPARPEPPITDFFGDLAHTESTAVSEPFAPDSAAADVPDWMSALTTPEPAIAAPEPSIAQPPTDDWLTDLRAVSDTPAEPSPEVEPAHADLPDWMSALAPADSPAESGVSLEAEPAHPNLPDWMNDLAPNEPVRESPAPVQTPTPSPAPELEDEWLRGFESETAAEQPLDTVPEPDNAAAEAIPATPAAENDRDWLSSIGSAPPDSSDDWLSRFGVVESPTSAEAPVEPVAAESPSWLTDDSSIQTQAPAAMEFPSAQVEPEKLPDLPEPAAKPPSSFGMTGLLHALSKTATESRPVEDAGVINMGQSPDWLTAFNDEPPPAEAAPEAEQAAPVASAPAAQEAAPATGSDADVPSWLRSAGDGETSTGYSEREPEAPAETPTSMPAAAKPTEDVFDPNHVPDFISALAPQEQAAPPVESGTGFRFDKTPPWMRKLKK